MQIDLSLSPDELAILLGWAMDAEWEKCFRDEENALKEQLETLAAKHLGQKWVDDLQKRNDP